MESIQTAPDLTRSQFSRISRLVHQYSGILLNQGKEGLIRTRLSKRLRLLGISSFDQYLELLQAPGSSLELSDMVDALTINKTGFFREIQHFDYLRTKILPQIVAGRRRMRFWCAGCSSGEEPYSLAVQLREEIPDIDRRDYRILATDICSRILEKARAAIYDAESLEEVPATFRQRYFKPTGSPAHPRFQVIDPVKSMISIARLNLIGTWPMKGPFDVIFCRNVMIYFDKATQTSLVRRFWGLLPPGGYLFVGHSESLAGAAQGFRYVQPAIYVK